MINSRNYLDDNRISWKSVYLRGTEKEEQIFRIMINNRNQVILKI